MIAGILLVVILLQALGHSQRRRDRIEEVMALDVLLTRANRWHNLQVRLFEGPVPSRHELQEAQNDLALAINGLKVILEN